MLSRIFYTIKQYVRYRSALATFLAPQNPWQTKTLTEVTVAWLNEQHIEVLVLDFDGVLAVHGEATPCPEVVRWLEGLTSTWAGQIYILSNKPLPIRQQYFVQTFPKISFVVAKHKKPYPDGLQEILAKTGVAPERVVLADDRLLTGVLAAQIAGTQALYISQPYQNFSKRPIHESFFAVLRAIEKMAL